MWNVVQSSQLGARSQVLVVRCTGLRYQLCCCLLGKGGFFSVQAAASTVRWMMPGEGRSRQTGTSDGWCRYLRSSVANVSGSSSVSEVRWPVEVDHQRGRCPANCGENQLAPGKRYLPLSCCVQSRAVADAFFHCSCFFFACSSLSVVSSSQAKVFWGPSDRLQRMTPPLLRIRLARLAFCGLMQIHCLNRRAEWRYRYLCLPLTRGQMASSRTYLCWIVQSLAWLPKAGTSVPSHWFLTFGGGLHSTLALSLACLNLALGPAIRRAGG
ncbi:hypothetical protein K456DRAFT_428871 [Colletotrichum gloeosporioides 23]|nr:hypothetical protein K456DRAFT_428871 [Colletotrichum gloeosporioides 23]